jgi:hypothetical protein
MRNKFWGGGPEGGPEGLDHSIGKAIMKIEFKEGCEKLLGVF